MDIRSVKTGEYLVLGVLMKPLLMLTEIKQDIDIMVVSSSSQG